MPQIHPLAVVEDGAQLAADVIVGPLAYIGPKVTLGPGCVVHHHASIEGHTTVGARNEFFPHCVIGSISQDLKYRGGDCQVVIGDDNRFREGCTVHIGTEDGGYFTRIGNDNLLMIGAHVAHDCLIANHCILANNVLLAGHVELEDWVNLAGAVASHHFVRFGKHCFVGGVSGITRDVPPFMIADGHPSSIRGVNVNGLRRRGFDEARLEPLKTAYRMLFRDTTPMAPLFAELQKLYPDNPDITYLLNFLRDAIRGKFGRYRELIRGKPNGEQDDPGTVSGN
ncbi:MAG: acyl-ACP--UDP-N-acetylglucosamine O-acyltransferase [Phycisphaerae bacterium]